MTTATTPATQSTESQGSATKTIGDVLAKRGIDEFQWSTLRNSLFPGARSESVLMVIDYCKARKLDPMKKPCHIVPMKVKDQKSGEYEWRDVVMAGIYEYRTTAMRTGNYLGHSKPEFGPVVEAFGVMAPEWCAMTMYRRMSNGERIEFPVCVYFRESCATKFDKETKRDLANDRWSKAPIQMLTKVTEAAGLREAFPDEFGGESTAEEMDGRSQTIDAEVVGPTIKPAERKSEQAKGTPAPASSQGSESTSTAGTANPQAPSPKVEEAALEVAPANTGAPVNVGTITNIEENGEYIAITLNTGFRCSTKDADMKSAARNHQASERVIELITTQRGDPAKFMPALTGIEPVAAE